MTFKTTFKAVLRVLAVNSKQTQEHLAKLEFKDKRASVFRFIDSKELARVVNESHIVFVDKGAADSFSRILNTPYKHLHVLPGAEPSKEWSSLKSILQLLIAQDCRRDSKILIVGGGAFCDVCAFAASIYMRGISFSLIPSTLLAQVDATIGGKTAINFEQKKNFVGSFAPAQEILWHLPLVLHTPALQRKSGFAEVIKAALLGDIGLFTSIKTYVHKLNEWLHSEYSPDTNKDALAWLGGDQIIKDMLLRAAKVKISIVQKDYKETGIRAYLNLGHSFAHAIESMSLRSENKSPQQYEHGIAVALGIYIALQLGMTMGISDGDYVQEVQGLLSALSYPTNLVGFSASALVAAMRFDKKNKSNDLQKDKIQGEAYNTHTKILSPSPRKIRLVLQSQICKTLLREVDESTITSCLIALGADK